MLLNAEAQGARGAGTRRTRERLRRLLADVGVLAEIEVVPAARLTARARELAASGARMVIAAGGNGTTSAVAAALVGGDVPLGLLPLGNRNHFAADLGVTGDPAAAARVIAGGAVRSVDVGEASEILVEASATRLLVAMDGEVVAMRRPPHCRVRQRALRVVAPPLSA